MTQRYVSAGGSRCDRRCITHRRSAEKVTGLRAPTTAPPLRFETVQMNVAQRMRAGIALAAWLLAVTASAQEPGRAPQSGARIELDSVAALVAAVAGCAALHSAAAEALERGGLPAYADVARRRA